jgi:hypothetical protein
MADGRGKARHWAAIGCVVAMARRKIGIHKVAEVVPLACARGKGMGKGLCDQVVLRVEVPVKAAMGEPRGFHYFRHADGLEALIAKERAGNIQDSAAVFYHLLPTDLHYKLPHKPIDIFMMDIMFAQT